MASLMIEYYIKGEITRTDMENFVLRYSLEHEYEKSFSNEPFGINRKTILDPIDEKDFQQNIKIKAEINKS